MPYDRKFYEDAMRSAAFSKARALLVPALDKLFPGEHIRLERIGLRRDFNTEEIELRLHIRPLASARVVGDNEWQEFTPIATGQGQNSGCQKHAEADHPNPASHPPWWRRVMPNRFRKLPPP